MDRSGAGGPTPDFSFDLNDNLLQVVEEKDVRSDWAAAGAGVVSGPPGARRTVAYTTRYHYNGLDRLEEQTDGNWGRTARFGYYRSGSRTVNEPVVAEDATIVAKEEGAVPVKETPPASRPASAQAETIVEQGAPKNPGGGAKPTAEPSPPSETTGSVTAKTPVEEGQAPSSAAAESAENIPSWKQYEMRHGGQQTIVRTTFEGREVTVRLDKPPSGSQIIDFKDYNWNNPTYQKPFIQQKVINDFQTQIRKYQTIQPNVHLQFSQEPPSWVVNAIKEAGGTYSVKR